VIDSDSYADKALTDKRVFLSASVPTGKRAERFPRAADAHVEVEEAVVSLTRAVVSAGAQLVYGGHPSISRLIAQVAGEYVRPAQVEREGRQEPEEKTEQQRRSPVLVFQSEAFRGYVPDETWSLQRIGWARIYWEDAVDGEYFDPQQAQVEPPCPKSLLRMREKMFRETAPDAMVCIGGMEGVVEELDLFLEMVPESLVYLIASTGGAAAFLAKEPRERVQVFDEGVMSSIRELREKQRGERRERHGDEFEKGEYLDLIPYPLIMQTLVEEVTGRGAGGRFSG
jgi:hypothetical protein